MAQLKFELKSPLSPFFKGDFSVQDFKPLFGKEGKGRFFGGTAKEIMLRVSEPAR
jgi:hypothetical protein